MTNEYIESVVDDILKQAQAAKIYNYDNATPVHLICEKICNLKFYYTDSLDEDLLGLLDFSSNTIFVNDTQIDTQSQYDERENFTVSHECGHYVLHKEIYDNNPELMMSFHIDTENEEHKESISIIERQANHFAACLLMPREVVIKQCPTPEEMKEIQNYEELLEYLKSFFRVSMSAMWNRLSYLKLV